MATIDNLRNNNYPNLSTIDLGEFEIRVRDQYIISKENPLFILM